jgi:DNA (cytosine-5)-methyltransferase 1
MENVPEMDGTLVADSQGELVELLALLSLLLPDYTGTWRTIEFADYGVPQRRQRLITVFVRNDVAASLTELDLDARVLHLFPEQTHAKSPNMFQEQWVSVLDAIGHLPPLDASSPELARSEEIDFHYVPILDQRKYWWVSQTPPKSSAFDNQCANPECMSTANPTHGNARVDGINRSKQDTPIFCVECGELLPRPCVEDESGVRLMRGFTSAYKRMDGNLPAPAMTRNLSYACSDQKLHPSQNRVLSLHEAMVLQTIANYDYSWTLPNGKRASDKLIRDTIGESVPPQGLEVIFRHLFERVLGGEDVAQQRDGEPSFAA